MRTQVMRAEVHRLLQQVPFRPFVLTLENGETVLIDHPENIAFDPAVDNSGNGSADFYVISGGLRLFSTFGAVTSATLADLLSIE